MSDIKRILIVDDEEDIVWAISRTLRRSVFDFEVACASDGFEALERLNEAEFDMLVTDFRMPGRNGMQVAQEARRFYPGIKVIIMTAYGSADAREQAEDLGYLTLVEKPFEMRSFKQLIFDSLGLSAEFASGAIESAGLRELVELNCARRQNLAMHVTRNMQNGSIHFKNGDVVHAECGNLMGERAFFDILNWNNGTFKIHHNSIETRRTISRDWRTLLHQCI